VNYDATGRIVDLIWRLSTHAMKMQLTRGVLGYQLIPVPTRDGADAVEAIQLLKV
jgi:hypothetical protein